MQLLVNAFTVQRLIDWLMETFFHLVFADRIAAFFFLVSSSSLPGSQCCCSVCRDINRTVQFPSQTNPDTGEFPRALFHGSSDVFSWTGSLILPCSLSLTPDPPSSAQNTAIKTCRQSCVYSCTSMNISVIIYRLDAPTGDDTFHRILCRTWE